MIPKRYEDVKFEDIDKTIQELYPTIRKERRGLYIHGGVGTGKTFAAYGIYKKWNEERESEEKTIQEVKEKYKPNNGMRNPSPLIVGLSH